MQVRVEGMCAPVRRCGQRAPSPPHLVVDIIGGRACTYHGHDEERERGREAAPAAVVFHASGSSRSAEGVTVFVEWE